jgi:DNA-directed RNA polymerase alpha subunit
VKKVCDKGHTFYKTSDCPSCPVCAQEEKPKTGLLSRVNAPVRNAFKHEGILTAEQLAQYSEKEILSLHGVGKASMPILREVLAEKGLAFKDHHKN